MTAEHFDNPNYPFRDDTWDEPAPTPDREEALRLAQDWFNEDAETVKDADLIVRAFLALAADLEATERLQRSDSQRAYELGNALEAAERELLILRKGVELLNEFYESFQDVEHAIVDFDLHSEMVERLKAADKAVAEFKARKRTV